MESMATADEVLSFLSGVLRGTESGSTAAMKAAELLGKRMGLFGECEDALPAPVIYDDIPSESGGEGE